MKNYDSIKVMIVDDYAPIRHSLRILLAEVRNVEVIVEAEDGKEAIEYIQNCKIQPDIVIMDVNMPVMNGIEATQWITTVFPHIKVIAFSSSDDQETIENMYEVGASAFLNKECDFFEMITAISSIIQGKKFF